MTALYIVSGITLGVVLIIGLFFLVAYLTFRKAFFVPKKRNFDNYDLPKDAQYSSQKPKMIELIDEMNALSYEQVYITSFDGLRLAGKYYHVSDDAPLQIQFHGYRGGAIRDFCGGNKLARESGFNTLVVDQRAHGLSEGNVITFGIKEKFDCLSWIEYAQNRFIGKPIYLAGVSMGATTVLMASPEVPPCVKGIIADCPYSSPSEIIKKVCSVDMHLPKRLSYALLKFGAMFFGKFDLDSPGADEAVKNAKAPILLIHGEADKFVPTEMSRQIASNNPSIRLETFPGAGHGISYIIDPERYARVVHEFLSSMENK